MRLVYSLLFFLALPFLVPIHLLRRPGFLRKRWLREKFGFFSFNQKAQDPDGGIWIHAVSVGETLGARGLIEALRNRFPKRSMILSTMTDTGQEVARKNFKDITIVYMPFDIGFVMRRVLRRFNTALFITMETELWPNTFIECKKLGIPVVVVNARISERSFRGYKIITPFMRLVFDAVKAFCCGSEIDAMRLRALGVEESRISITGNLKFDMPEPERPGLRLLNPQSKKIIVVGSTHPGEEEIILKELEELLKKHTIFIILAPRHPQRFQEVEELVKSRGISLIRRSEVRDSFNIDQAELMLLDTMGELASFYCLADIAIIGGSFVPVGGHNLLEPAYWSKPVICGRHMDNFPLAQEFFRERAALMVEKERIKETVLELCNSEDRRNQMGERARKIYERNSGSLERTLSVLERVLVTSVICR